MLDSLASHLDTIATHAPVWGYALVFAFMAIESSFIPFPSEIVMIPAGFLAARGELTLRAPIPDLAVACAVGIAGSLAGAYFNYYLSAKLGEPFLRKHGKWIFLKPDALDRACEVFNRYGNATTFVCRLIPVIRQLISIPAGLARMPLGKFTLFTGLGAGIWTVILAVVGYVLGRTAGDITYLELVHRGKALLDENLVWIILGAVLLMAIYILVAKRVMRRRTCGTACLAFIALAVAGCGKKPQVPEDAIAAAYVDIEKAYENGTLLAKAIIGEFPAPASSMAMKAYDKELETIDEYRGTLKPKWAVIAFGGPVSDLSRAPSENIAMAIRIDADEAAADNVLRLQATKRAGKKDVEPKTLKNGVVYDVYSAFCAGRVGNDLLIFANSTNAFMNMYNLYTGESKPSNDFRKLSDISGNTVARISTIPVYSMIERFGLTEEIEKFGTASDDKDLADMILHIGAVTLDILADGDDIGLSLHVVCGSSDDAKIFEHVFQTISFLSRAGFDFGAYLADNPDRLPKKFRGHSSWIRQSKSLFNATSRAFDASRNGRVAELSFGNSIDMIGKSIAKIIIPEQPAGEGDPKPPSH